MTGRSTPSPARHEVSGRSVFLVVLVLLLVGCSGQAGDRATPNPSSSATTVRLAAGTRIPSGGSEALVWGQGTGGVVLAHGAAFDAASWEPQATRIAAQGATVLAVEDISPSGILAGVDYLREKRGVRSVALLGGSAGADGILTLSSQQPSLADRLILLSPNAVVEGLGSQPKLFIASEGEPVADVSRRLAASTPGVENEVDILPGSAHAQNIFATDQGEAVTRTILARLKSQDTP